MQQAPVHSPRQTVTLEEWIYVAELARLLDLTEDAIRRQVRDGTFPIPPVRNLGRRLRWRAVTIRAWLADLQKRDAANVTHARFGAKPRKKARDA